MMRMKVRRVLDRLRGLTDGWLRGGISVRGGLQEPQRLQTLLGKFAADLPGDVLLRGSQSGHRRCADVAFDASATPGGGGRSH